MSPQAPGLPPGPPRSGRPRPAGRAARTKTRSRVPWRLLLLRTAIVIGSVSVVSGIAIYLSLARLIDDRLYGERERSLPRVYARPIEIRRGQTFTQQDLIARLNDIGYAQRPEVSQPGEFAVMANEIAITPRSADL